MWSVSYICFFFYSELGSRLTLFSCRRFLFATRGAWSIFLFSFHYSTGFYQLAVSRKKSNVSRNVFNKGKKGSMNKDQFKHYFQHLTVTATCYILVLTDIFVFLSVQPVKSCMKNLPVCTSRSVTLLFFLPGVSSLNFAYALWTQSDLNVFLVSHFFFLLSFLTCLTSQSPILTFIFLLLLSYFFSIYLSSKPSYMHLIV